MLHANLPQSHIRHAGYQNIRIAGHDTATPLALAKRLRVIEQHLSPAGRRFLDCGCGAGEYVAALVERLGLDAHGIEYDAEKVGLAHSKPQVRERVVQGDLQSIELPSASWDYAMLNEVLEHVPDERKALAEVFRVLKPGGLLFVFSPNRWFPFETHGVFLRRSGRIKTEYADEYDKICPGTCGDLPHTEVLNGIAAGRNALHARRIHVRRRSKSRT